MASSAERTSVLDFRCLSRKAARTLGLWPWAYSCGLHYDCFPWALAVPPQRDLLNFQFV